MGLDLKGTVSLDGSGFEAGLSRLEHAGKHAFSELKMFALQAFGVYAAQEMFHKSIEDAKELVNAAKRLGTEGVEGLQVLRQAAKDSSTDLETVEKAFEKIDVARAKILGKDKGYEKNKAAFGKLGITEADLSKMTAAQMFSGPIANAAKSMNQEVFGPLLKQATELKSVGALIPLLQTDFQELGDKMQHLGTIMSTETAVKLKTLGDETELLSRILLVNLAPAIIAVVEALLDWVGKIKVKAAELGGQAGAAETQKHGGLVATKLQAIGYQSILDTESDHPGSQSKRQIDEANKFFEDYAKVIQAGTDAAKPVQDDWTKTIEELRKRIADETDKLLHPKPADFSGSFTPHDEKSTKGSRIDSADSLVKVGNFLGDSQGALASIATQHLHETRAMHNTLKGMANRKLSADNTQQDPAFA